MKTFPSSLHPRLSAALIAALIVLSASPGLGAEEEGAKGQGQAAGPAEIAGSPPSIASLDYSVWEYPETAPDSSVSFKLSLRLKAALSPGLDPAKDVSGIIVSHGTSRWNLPKPAEGPWPIFAGGEGLTLARFARESGTLLALGSYHLRVSLSSGAVLDRDFTVLPPGELPLDGAEYLYTPSYSDLLTPWHRPDLAHPVITSVRIGKESLTIRFTVDDPQCANVSFEFVKDGKLVWRSNTMVDPATGKGRSWFNGGRGLLTDGAVNVAVYDMKTLKPLNGYRIEDCESIMAIATDGLRYRGGASPSTYRHMSISAPYRMSFGATPEGSRSEEGPSDRAEEPDPPPLPRLPTAQGDDRSYYDWLTGLSAVLALFNGQPAVGLAPLPPPPLYARNSADLLRGGWEITSHDELLAQVRKLVSGGGHDRTWQAYRRVLAENPGASDDELLAKLGERASSFRLRLVRSQASSRLGTDILAWDLGRAAVLVRWGFATGYVGAEEAWSLLEEIGAPVAARFSSWEDFGKDYILGRIFWNGEERDEGIKLFEDAQEIYVGLLGAEGAWTKTPWPLSEEDADESKP